MVRLTVKVIYSQVTLSQENVKPSQLVWPGLHFSKDNVALKNIKLEGSVIRNLQRNS